MRCFVTGATGFIGTSLVKRLIKEGYEVRGLIHKKKPIKFDERVEYVYGDIRDVSTIRSYLRDIDFVLHCAAYVKDFGPRNVFYETNIEGTKNLVSICKDFAIKRFIFLGHINYETDKAVGYYRESKTKAEDILKLEHRKNGFPIVIIRPGNVFGPGATTWVLRPLQSIKKNRIALVEYGRGIFLHTYIDNLLDAILASMLKKEAVGEDFDITDGDYSVTWDKYLNDLARIAGENQIKRNLSRKKALMIGNIMVILHKIFRVYPWITPYAIQIFTNKNIISIDKAKSILGYNPKVDYEEGMRNIEKWLKVENYI